MPPKLAASRIKPLRHFVGKGAVESSSDSDSEAEKVSEKAKPVRKIRPPLRVSAGQILSRGNNPKLNLDGLLQGVDSGQACKDAATRAREAEQLAKESGFVTESEESESEEGSDEGSDESSESDVPHYKLLKPRYLPKKERELATGDEARQDEDGEVLAARKQAEVDKLVEEQLLKQREPGMVVKNHWDDDQAEESDVDTEDDKDPEAAALELAAWRLRELRRIKRERDAIEVKEKELAEIERRRNLTEEERRAEDEAHIAAQKVEKDSRGKMAYMQKYFHKGAFYVDSEEAAALASRDIMAARFQDDVADRELLPQALQMRDMTRLGRKGATKYKDLKSEDTGTWGQPTDGRPRTGSGRLGDERFRPDRDRAGGGLEGQGANAIPLGERKKMQTGADPSRDGRRNGGRAGDGNGERDRHRSFDARDRARTRSRSRPRSPRRDDDGKERRKRESSLQRDGYDKRQRVNSA